VPIALAKLREAVFQRQSGCAIVAPPKDPNANPGAGGVIEYTTVTLTDATFALMSQMNLREDLVTHTRGLGRPKNPMTKHRDRW
jgi:hypothetical protein